MIAAATSTRPVQRPLGVADVVIDGLSEDSATAESLVGDLIEERDERLTDGHAGRGRFVGQLLAAGLSLLGRQLRSSPIGVIGSVVLGWAAPFALTAMTVAALVGLSALAAAGGPDLLGTDTPVPALLLSALVSGGLCGAVAALTHPRAPLAPVILVVVATIALEIVSAVNFQIQVGAPTPGQLVGDIAGAVLTIVGIAGAGYLVAHRRARRGHR